MLIIVVGTGDGDNILLQDFRTSEFDHKDQSSISRVSGLDNELKLWRPSIVTRDCDSQKFSFLMLSVPFFSF